MFKLYYLKTYDLIIQIFTPVTSYSEIFSKSDPYLLESLNQSAIDHAAILTRYRRLVSVGVLIMWIKILKYIIYVLTFNQKEQDIQSAEPVPGDHHQCSRIYDLLPDPPDNRHPFLQLLRLLLLRQLHFGSVDFLRKFSVTSIFILPFKLCDWNDAWN